MTVNEIPLNTRCFEYKQNREDTDYGTCLYARFYFNLEKYEVVVISDCGNYAYQWLPIPESESLLSLMTKMNGVDLLRKLCGRPQEFDYEATKERFYEYNPDRHQRLDEIFEEIERRLIPEDDKTFTEMFEMFERENDGWCDVEYLAYDYTPSQKKIARIFQENIQPALRTENTMYIRQLLSMGKWLSILRH